MHEIILAILGVSENPKYSTFNILLRIHCPFLEINTGNLRGAFRIQ